MVWEDVKAEEVAQRFGKKEVDTFLESLIKRRKEERDQEIANIRDSGLDPDIARQQISWAMSTHGTDQQIREAAKKEIGGAGGSRFSYDTARQKLASVAQSASAKPSAIDLAAQEAIADLKSRIQTGQVGGGAGIAGLAQLPQILAAALVNATKEMKIPTPEDIANAISKKCFQLCPNTIQKIQKAMTSEEAMESVFTGMFAALQASIKNGAAAQLAALRAMITDVREGNMTLKAFLDAATQGRSLHVHDHHVESLMQKNNKELMSGVKVKPEGFRGSRGFVGLPGGRGSDFSMAGTAGRGSDFSMAGMSGRGSGTGMEGRHFGELIQAFRNFGAFLGMGSDRRPSGTNTRPSSRPPVWGYGGPQLSRQEQASPGQPSGYRPPNPNAPIVTGSGYRPPNPNIPINPPDSSPYVPPTAETPTRTDIRRNFENLNPHMRLFAPSVEPTQNENLYNTLTKLKDNLSDRSNNFDAFTLAGQGAIQTLQRIEELNIEGPADFNRSNVRSELAELAASIREAMGAEFGQHDEQFLRLLQLINDKLTNPEQANATTNSTIDINFNVSGAIESENTEAIASIENQVQGVLDVINNVISADPRFIGANITPPTV